MSYQTLVAREVIPFDIDRQEHAEFMYDLAMACKEDFLNDYDNDIILVMNGYARQLKSGSVVAFLAMEGGQKVGIIWVELLSYGIGRLRAGLMPEARKGYTALWFLKHFIDFCFDNLDIRKLDAEVTLGERVQGENGKTRYTTSRTLRAAETLLRRFGFRKEGQVKEALTINGKPRDTLLFGFTRNQFKGKKSNEQKENGKHAATRHA